MNDFYLVVRTDKGFLALADGFHRGWTSSLQGARFFRSYDEAMVALSNKGIELKRGNHYEIRPIEYYLSEAVDREAL